MRFEIEKHWDKLKRISKLSDKELQEAYFRIFSAIKFINEELIPEKKWKEAEILTKDVDTNDLDFIAVTLHLKANLWTGDKILYRGLKKKNFKKVYNTSELLAIRE